MLSQPKGPKLFYTISWGWTFLSWRFLSLLSYSMCSHTCRILHSTLRMAGLDLEGFLPTPLFSVVILYLIKGLAKIKSSACLKISLSVLELTSMQSKEQKVSLVLHGSFRSTETNYNQRHSFCSLFLAVFLKAELFRSHCP